MKPVIETKDVSKKFMIPHERVDSLKGTILSIYKKKTYEEFYALKGISFAINKGEFIGVIGRNGSGKSTLLKVLAGIYTQDSGKITVREKLSPFLELGVGFNGELSGRDNIYLYGAVLGLSKSQIDSRFRSIVAFAELERFIDLKMKNYSSGMYVRLAFSVAIQADAGILLIDEVLAVGDAGFQDKCLGVFERYRKEEKTVMLASHDLSLIEKLCKRSMLLENGEIRMISDTKTVVSVYHSALAAAKLQ